ncbi:lanthionine synthetase LanC family protein [Actinomadura scrupuli]|uniref:lanthionine synthetase LanC family protein n=1 Tax=Actinomadura scrupuli TaxID=559629 RepID=UPI003D954D14
MSTYRDQLDVLARSVRIMDGSAFCWFGRRIPVASPADGDGMGPLRTLLARHLYELFYVVGHPVPAGVRLVRSGGQLDGAFVDTIHDAACGSGPSEDHWRFVASRQDGVVAEREGITFLVPHGSVTREPPADGTGKIAVRQPLLLRAPQPGFCFVLGTTPFPAAGSDPVQRLYWNVHADGATALVRMLTKELNGRSVPFALKLINMADAYTRCDAAVLYVPGRHLPGALDVVARRHPGAAWALKDGVPALTKRLARGVGAAEDPGTGESFGQHRCRLVAEALSDAEVLASRGAARRARAFAERLEARGVSVAAPYLNPGSSDRLVLPSVRHGGRGPRRATAGAGLGRRRLISAAAGVGELLLEEALWRGAECTWMGPRHDGPSPGARPAPRGSWSALGADVYLGTAGLACLLAPLAGLVGDDRFGRAAAGALAYAAQETERNLRPAEASLHLGWTGVAMCLLRLGGPLGRPDLVARGERMVRDRLGQDLVCQADDRLAGLAGNITGLLALADAGVRGPVIDIADRLGRELLARAVRTGDIRTWPNPAHAAVPLTGLAHGAAGIALSLTELAAATGHEEYRTAAFEAIEYERRRFSRIQRNWPDYRRQPSVTGQPRRGRRYSVGWCHGAPGIALGRMRMWAALGGDDLRAEAALGFETTVRSLAWMSGDAIERMVLCHGLGGNLVIARTLERQGLTAPPELTGAADTAAEHLCERAELAGADGGVSDWARRTPSLLTGAAGIGHLLLSEAGEGTSGLPSSLVLG